MIVSFATAQAWGRHGEVLTQTTLEKSLKEAGDGGLTNGLEVANSVLGNG